MRIIKITLLITVVFALVLVSSALYNNYSVANWKKSAEKKGSFVNSGGRRIFTMRKGSAGPAVLIISDSGSSMAEWEMLSDELGKSFSVIAYDRAGCGLSDPVPANYSARDAIDDLNWVINFYDIDKFYAIGHGTGSILLQLYTKLYPDRVNGMIIVEPLVRGHMSIKKNMDRVIYSNLFDRRTSVKIGKVLGLLGIVRLVNGVPVSGIPASQRRAVMEHYCSASVYDTSLYEMRKIVPEALKDIGTPASVDFPVVLLRHDPDKFRKELMTYYLSWDQAEDVENLLFSFDHEELKVYPRGRMEVAANGTRNLHVSDYEKIIEELRVFEKQKTP